MMGWWNTAGRAHFPLVTEVALLLLSAHSTTAACERVWSGMGRLYVPQRNAMKLDTAYKLCYIKANSTRSLGLQGPHEEVMLGYCSADSEESDTPEGVSL